MAAVAAVILLAAFAWFVLHLVRGFTSNAPDDDVDDVDSKETSPVPLIENPPPSFGRKEFFISTPIVEDKTQVIIEPVKLVGPPPTLDDIRNEAERLVKWPWLFLFSDLFSSYGPNYNIVELAINYLRGVSRPKVGDTYYVLAGKSFGVSAEVTGVSGGKICLRNAKGHRFCLSPEHVSPFDPLREFVVSDGVHAIIFWPEMPMHLMRVRILEEHTSFPGLWFVTRPLIGDTHLIPEQCLRPSRVITLTQVQAVLEAHDNEACKDQTTTASTSSSSLDSRPSAGAPCSSSATEH